MSGFASCVGDVHARKPEAQTFRSNAKESALEAHGRVRRVVGATCQRLVLDPRAQTLNPKPETAGAGMNLNFGVGFIL